MFPYAEPLHCAPIANPCAVLVRVASPVAPETGVPLNNPLITVEPDVNENIFGLLVAIDWFIN